MENIFKVILVGRLDEQGVPQTGIVLVSKASIDKNLKREPLFGNGKKQKSSSHKLWKLNHKDNRFFQTNTVRTNTVELCLGRNP